jgi:hypothetical protein
MHAPGHPYTVLVRDSEDNPNSTPKFFIIKDLWVSGTRFLESELFEPHAERAVPWLEPDEICPPEDEEIEIPMTKNSYITGNMGEPITQCKSVLEILQLMYDLVVSKYMLLHQPQSEYLISHSSSNHVQEQCTPSRYQLEKHSPEHARRSDHGEIYWIYSVRTN